MASACALSLLKAARLPCETFIRAAHSIPNTGSGHALYYIPSWRTRLCYPKCTFLHRQSTAADRLTGFERFAAMGKRSKFKPEVPSPPPPKTPPSDGLASSPLGNLPPELRNRISELALARPKPYVYALQEWIPKRPGLRLCCKTISQECTQLFYAVNTFVFQNCSAFNSLRHLERFTKKIGMLNAAALRNLVLQADLATSLWDRSSRYELVKLIKTTIDESVLYPLRRYTIQAMFRPNLRNLSNRNLITTVDVDVKNGVIGWEKTLKHINDSIFSAASDEDRARMKKVRGLLNNFRTYKGVKGKALAATLDAPRS